MPNFLKKQIKKLKATVKYIIVAFMFSSLILSATYILFSKQIKSLSTTLELISFKSNKRILKNVKINLETNTLVNYPSYGANYGKLTIPDINVELPIYYGDELEFLKYGIGHTAGTYFPGEGGSILYMGHNTSDMLKRLPELNIGAKITIETSYGIYNYEIYEGKVIEDTDFDSVPIQREKELLMIYTCYPTNTITYTPYRYIIYANKI